MVRNFKYAGSFILVMLSGLIFAVYSTDKIIVRKPLSGNRATVRDSIKLRMVPVVESPVIEKKNYKLTIDFVFDRCPQEYWVYYNKAKGKLIIEFFGINIIAPPVTIKGTSVVSNLLISNLETILSLNGKSAQLSMAIEQGWHYNSGVINGKILRLQLWMPLNPSKDLQKQKNKHTLPLVLAVVAGAAATVAIIFVAASTMFRQQE